MAIIYSILEIVFLSHNCFHFLFGNYLTQFFTDTAMKFYNNIVLEYKKVRNISTKIRT